MNRKELHDKLCKEADELTAKYDPCKIKTADGVTTCTGKEICCAPCDYLSPEGCTIKSLGCKLYFCYAVQKKYPEVVREMHKIRNKAKKYRLIKMREPFKEKEI